MRITIWVSEKREPLGGRLLQTVWYPRSAVQGWKVLTSGMVVLNDEEPAEDEDELIEDDELTEDEEPTEASPQKIE